MKLEGALLAKFERVAKVGPPKYGLITAHSDTRFRRLRVITLCGRVAGRPWAFPIQDMEIDTPDGPRFYGIFFGGN